MGVQAKFYVAEVTLRGKAGENRWAAVKLNAVTRGGANAEWSKATPTGELTMTISTPGAIAWYTDRIGEEVAIRFDDFTVPTLEDGHAFVPMPEGHEPSTSCQACGCVHPVTE